MSGFEDVLGPRDLPGAELRPPRVRLLGEGIAQGRDVEEGGGRSGFGSALLEALDEVRRLGEESKNKAEALARGEPVDVHDLMIAAGKSEVAFNLMLEVRNKLIEAWQTLSRSVI